MKEPREVDPDELADVTLYPELVFFFVRFHVKTFGKKERKLMGQQTQVHKESASPSTTPCINYTLSSSCPPWFENNFPEKHHRSGRPSTLAERD